MDVADDEITHRLSVKKPGKRTPGFPCYFTSSFALRDTAPNVPSKFLPAPAPKSHTPQFGTHIEAQSCTLGPPRPASAPFPRSCAAAHCGSCAASARHAAARGCTGGPPLWKTSRAAHFHDRPAYITATRSAHLRHHRQVMRDEQHRQTMSVPQLLQQFQNLRLDRDIERRRRFIGNQQSRTVHNRHRDHDPLPHPARKLVRIVPRPPPASAIAYLVHRLHRALSTPRLLRHRDAPAPPPPSGRPPASPGSAPSSAPGRSCNPRIRAPAAAFPYPANASVVHQTRSRR